MSKHLVTLIYGKLVGKATTSDGEGASAAFRKAVLVAMADRANDDGSGIYVSKKRIAAEIECDRSTVVRVCQTLEDDSLIHAVGKKAGNHGYTVIYQISLSKIQDLPDAWSKSGNRNTLDEALGEDSEVTASATLGEVQVLQRGRSSVAARDKNRPFRTIDNNSISKKTDAPRPKSLSDQADLLLWEARRVRASGDHERAVEMEQQASDLLAQDSDIKTKTEH